MRKALLLIAAAVLGTGVAKGADKPNVLFVLVDDMGWSDLGCYGSEIETPNIDLGNVILKGKTSE